MSHKDLDPWMEVAVAPMPSSITPESFQLAIEVQMATIASDGTGVDAIRRIYGMMNKIPSMELTPQTLPEAKQELKEILMAAATFVFSSYSSRLCYTEVKCPCCNERINLVATGGMTSDPEMIPAYDMVNGLWMIEFNRWVHKNPAEYLAAFWGGEYASG